MALSDSIIAGEVEIGHGTVILPGCVLIGPLTIGENCRIGPYAIIGSQSEYVSLTETDPHLIAASGVGATIGDNVIIREFVSIQRGTEQPTFIGDRSYLATRCYVAHDVQIGTGSVLTAGVAIGGHANLGAGVRIGLNAVVHQHSTIGRGAMIGQGCSVHRDVPPFMKYVNGRIFAINEPAIAEHLDPQDYHEQLQSLTGFFERKLTLGDMKFTSGPIGEAFREFLLWSERPMASRK